jgi:hypothetical protein
MATSKTCGHLPGEMLNLAATAADRARIHLRCLLKSILVHLCCSWQHFGGPVVVVGRPVPQVHRRARTSGDRLADNRFVPTKDVADVEAFEIGVERRVADAEEFPTNIRV